MAGSSSNAGGSLGYGEQESTPVAVSTWNAQQQALWNALANKLQQGVESQVAAYPGQMYAAENPQESAYFNYVQQGEEARQNAINQILSGQLTEEQQQLYQDPTALQNYYNQAIRDPALREYRETTLPQISESFAGPGYWGSARAQAQAKAAEDLATNLAAQRATLEYQNRQQYEQALSDALTRQAQYGPTAATQEATLLGTAGQYARQIENEQVAADLQRWLMGETVEGVTPSQYSPWLQLVFQSLGLTSYAIGQESEGTSFGLGIS